MTSDNPLREELRARIASKGPITFCRWMESALYDAEHGYYRAPDRQRWGREGDYRTSPERSILFSATFARYFAQLHNDMGDPRVWTILESGAGEGYFAASVLETMQREFSQTYEAVSYVIDEASGLTQRLARQRLENFTKKVRFVSMAEAGAFEGVVFANELLDALPVHRVTVRDGELCEFYIDLNSQLDFIWRTGPLSDGRLQQYFERFSVRISEGQIAEVNLAAEDWLREVANHLTSGFVVLVDYGAEASELFSERPEGTLRSIHRHHFVDEFLTEPGAYDITATVNWTHIKDAAERARFGVLRFQAQSQFLLEAGFVDELELRTETAADEGERASLRSEAREMILPGGMSDSFQVLVLSKGLRF